MRRDLAIVFQVGFGFLTIFSAFNSQGFIEISVLRNISQDPSSGLSDKSGFYSLSIIYFVFTFSNLVAPPIISVLGAKWAQVCGALCYSVFLSSFLHLRQWLLYACSGVLGFGAAILWTANGAFLVENSREGKMERNSGIMWAMLQGSLIVGASFLLFIASTADLVSSYRFIYSVFTGLSIIGALFLALLPSNPAAEMSVFPELDDSEPLMDEEQGTDPGVRSFVIPEERTLREEFKNTFALAKTKHMLALAVCFMYSGIELTFYSGIYTSCLAAAKALNNGSDVIIPYNALAIGAGQILGGLGFGPCLGNRLTRSVVVGCGAFFHLIAYVICFLNLPNDSPLHDTSASGIIQPSIGLALFAGFLLGLGDSSLNTQIYSLIGAMYPSDSPSAFSLFKFYQSLAACAGFFYGSILLLHWQLIVLATGAVLTVFSFVGVDHHARQLESSP